MLWDILIKHFRLLRFVVLGTLSKYLCYLLYTSEVVWQTFSLENNSERICLLGFSKFIRKHNFQMEPFVQPCMEIMITLMILEKKPQNFQILTSSLPNSYNSFLLCWGSWTVIEAIPFSTVQAIIVCAWFKWYSSSCGSHVHWIFSLINCLHLVLYLQMRI